MEIPEGHDFLYKPLMTWYNASNDIMHTFGGNDI